MADVCLNEMIVHRPSEKGGHVHAIDIVCLTGEVHVRNDVHGLPYGLRGQTRWETSAFESLPYHPGQIAIQ